MITRSVFDIEIKVLEEWFETTLSESQKEKFYSCIKFALDDKEFFNSCLIQVRNYHFFPTPSQIIEDAWEGAKRYDKR